MRLFYFDMMGRAEPIRLLLTHAGVPFEDVRVTPQDWPKYKNRFELKQMPVLEANGRMYCQSIAILEYLGLKHGYLPKNNYTKLYKIMKVINTTQDIFGKASLAVSSWSPLDEKGKADTLEDVLNKSGPLFVGSIEKALADNCSKDYIIGKSYTIADFVLIGVYGTLKKDETWNKLFYQRFTEKHPALHVYLEKRMRDFNHYYKVCKPKLYYFDFPGRAEMIRLMLKYLKIDFDDVRIKGEDWGKEKTSGKFELQQMPILECETCGIKLCQTDAIMQQIGTRFGLLPTRKPQKCYKVLWWCNTAKDIMEGCCKVYLPIPEEKKAEIMKGFYETSVPTLLQAMEDKLRVNKSQCYLVGRKDTIADFYLLGVWRGFMANSKEFKDMMPNYPLIKEYLEKKDKMY